MSRDYHISSPYTASEAQIISQYVSGGGGLMLLADWGPFTPDVQEIALAFGVTLNGDDITDWTIFDRDNFDTRHPIMAGINTIQYLAYTTMDPGTAFPLIWEDDGDVVAVTLFRVFGRGAIFGDYDWPSIFGDGYNREDNSQLAMQTVEWLYRPCPFEVMTPDASVLHSLRRFRDTMLAENETWQFLIGEYYYHSPEIVRILRRHPMLSIRSAAILKDVMPGVRFLLSDKKGRDIEMAPRLVTRIQKLFSDISKAGSDDLADTLSFLSEALDVCKGMRISEIWQAMEE